MIGRVSLTDTDTGDTEPMLPRVPTFGPPALGQRLGGYKLEKILGRGGMGAVYVGVNDAGARRAVKVPFYEREGSEIARARFTREAQVLARIPPHRGVVRVHAAGEEGHLTYCVLELIEGRTLEQILTKQGPLPIPKALEVAEQTARALAHLHKQGVVHRDVKPSNLLIRDEDGSVVLTDFGLVRDQTLESLTQTGTFVGTPIYVAPEQALATREVDGRADIYALGATLFALLTGRPPHQAGSLTELMRLLVTVDPAPPSSIRPEIPAALDALILRALAREPKDRHPDATAFADDLAALRAGKSIAQPSRSLPLALAAGGLAGLLVAATVFLGGSPPPPPVVPKDPVAEEKARTLAILGEALDHARAGRDPEACSALERLGARSGSLLDRVGALEPRLGGPNRDGAALLARLRAVVYAQLGSNEIAPIRAEVLGFFTRSLAARRELGLALVSEVLECAATRASAVELLLALDEKAPTTLRPRELVTARTAPGFAKLAHAVLARGDSARAVRHFERVLRHDPHAQPGEALEAALLHRQTDAVSNRDLPAAVDVMLDRLRIGAAETPPVWALDRIDIFDARLARESDDWAIRLLYANLLLKANEKLRERGPALARSVVNDESLPLIARARASLVLAEHLLQKKDVAGTVAAVVRAHALGHHEPDECSRIAAEAHRRAVAHGDPAGSIDEALAWARRALAETDDRLARMKEKTLAKDRPGLPPLVPVEDHDLDYDRRYQLVTILIAARTDAALDEAERVCGAARAIVESGSTAQPWRLLLAKVEYARDQGDAGDRLVDESFARDSHERPWLLRELDVMATELDEAGRHSGALRLRQKHAAMSKPR